MRWQRGLLESLTANRSLLFHPRGGAAGWVAFPVLGIFEALGPLIEVVGYLFMIATWLLGWVSWDGFSAFILAAVGMGLALSASALLLEEMSFHLYRKPSHLGALLAAMVLENLGYRQLTAWWRLRALLRWLLGGRGQWGVMTRSAAWQASGHAKNLVAAPIRRPVPAEAPSSQPRA
jgi:hypothetical protein